MKSETNTAILEKASQLLDNKVTFAHAVNQVKDVVSESQNAMELFSITVYHLAATLEEVEFHKEYPVDIQAQVILHPLQVVKKQCASLMLLAEAYQIPLEIGLNSLTSAKLQLLGTILDSTKRVEESSFPVSISVVNMCKTLLGCILNIIQPSGSTKKGE